MYKHYVVIKALVHAYRSKPTGSYCSFYKSYFICNRLNLNSFPFKYYYKLYVDMWMDVCVFVNGT